MRRLSLLVPALMFVACSDTGLVGPEPSVSPPSMDKIHEGVGGFTFTEDSGCTYDAQSQDITCSFTLQNLNPDHPYDAFAGSLWIGEYQCVHAKTGKTSNKYPPTRHHDSLQHEVVRLDSNPSGEITAITLVIHGPLDLSGICSSNKGAFTETRILAGATPDAWVIYVEDAEDDELWAQLRAFEF